LKAAVYAHQTQDVSPQTYAFADGLRRHGVEVELFSPEHRTPDADFVAAWGMRNCNRCKLPGRDFLILERGFIDRFNYTSLGWNGLNGRAQWNKAADNGERFDKLFGHLLADWCRADGYALVIGQVKGDAAILEVDIDSWYETAIRAMFDRGFEEVKIREHPVAVLQRKRLLSCQEYLITGSLEEALAGASVVVTYNSNTGVDAALAGVPVIACDEGSMAWPVAAHGLQEEIITPDRRQWCADLSWRQWSLDELKSGFAWEHIRREF
jgi:hypothetical protein